jgi:hypothetical protein
MTRLIKPRLSRQPKRDGTDLCAILSPRRARGFRYCLYCPESRVNSIVDMQWEDCGGRSRYPKNLLDRLTQLPPSD